MKLVGTMLLLAGVVLVYAVGVKGETPASLLKQVKLYLSPGGSSA